MKNSYTAKNQTERFELSLCPIDAVGMDDAVNEIQRLSKSNRCHYVVTPNVDHLQRLYLSRDGSALREIYRQASLSLCDSRILRLFMPLIGVSVPEVVPGSSLTQRLFDHILVAEDRILIIGGEKEVIESVRKKYQHLNIEHINPSMGFIYKAEEVDEIVRATHAVEPDYIFIAVGSPQQELLAHRIGAEIPRGIALCVGASLLFMAGKEKRAPGWVQTLSCEWFYRMLKNPRRLIKRYLMNLIYLPRIVYSMRQEGRYIRKIKANG